uniref:Glycoside hydrolase family 19 catalytic domain-containing protein n=3 Tax=Brassica TaxID=3705 RepID=A0A0D3CJG6_BRAOL
MTKTKKSLSYSYSPCSRNPSLQGNILFFFPYLQDTPLLSKSTRLQLSILTPHGLHHLTRRLLQQLLAHAVGFWDYRSFINAAAEYQPLGLDTAGDKLQGMKEVAAFLGGYGVATGGPLAWGLCYNKEMSPDQFYCDDYYKLTYPCTPGVSYYHVAPPTHAVDPPLWQSKRLPWTYGVIQSITRFNDSTLAFQAAIWRWMTPPRKHVLSAHNVFVGKWKTKKNNTAANRSPGFGTTINILWELEEKELVLVISCADQEPFSSSSSSSPPSTRSSS